MSLDQEAVLPLVAAAAARVGTPAFHDCLLALLAALAPTDSAQVMQFPIHGKPRYLSVLDTPTDIQNLYIGHYHHFDPIRRHLRQAPPFRVFVTAEVRPPGYDEGGYYSEFYKRVGCTDELSVILPGGPHHVMGLFLERDGYYSSEDMELPRSLFPIFLRLNQVHRRALLAGGVEVDAGDFAAAVAVMARDGGLAFANEPWQAQFADGSEAGRIADAIAVTPDLRSVATQYGSVHIEPIDEGGHGLPAGRLLILTPQVAGDRVVTDAAFETFLAGQLTSRERQIVRLGFAGYGNDCIAERLGIAEGTVKNHRKRLYDKLGIIAERQLFALFMSHLNDQGA